MKHAVLQRSSVRPLRSPSPQPTESELFKTQLLVLFFSFQWLLYLQDKIQRPGIQGLFQSIPNLPFFPFLPYVRHESLQSAARPFSGAPTHPSRPDTNVASSRKPSRMPPARINSPLLSILPAPVLCSVNDFHFYTPPVK